eukprot:m.93259 g.93259  ORF g.93259 m.93259 type:complete len:428 (+) comp12123_c1_seq1:170-1453(+)
MAGQSKLEKDAKDKAETEEYIMVCAASFFMLAFNMGALMNVRSLVLDEALKLAGSSTNTASLLGLTGTLGSLAEFVVCPAMGRLSDSYGRKNFIVGNLTVTMLMELVIYFMGGNKNVLIGAGVVSTASMTGFLTILRAGLSDKLTGTDLGVAHARTGIAAGLSVILGPLAASFIASRYNNRAVYLLAAAVTAVNIATLSLKMDETLAEDKRKPMKWEEANPMSFVRLLSNGARLRLCSFALAMQCIAEPRFVFPYATLIWRDRFNYDAATLGKLSSIFGLVYMIGAIVAKKRMTQVGARRHVTESNVANMLAWLAWSKYNGFNGTVASYCLFIPGIRKRDGLEVMITDTCSSQGWGKGEISAMMNNFKSMSAVLAPSLFSTSFTTATSNDNDFPGAPMFTAAATTLLSQVLYFAMLGLPEEVSTKSE